LKEAFPLFNEVDDLGRPKQQDAEECWSNVIQNLMNYHNREMMENLFKIDFACKYFSLG
jgi:hypothetical protein